MIRKPQSTGATLVLWSSLLLPQLAVAQSWYDVDWSYRKKITIDNTKVSTVDATDLSNFPVLINRTDIDWKDTANGGKVAQSDGGDLLFTSSDGTTKLDHEIESYDEATGELVVWVEVPTVSAGSDTDVFIYYGNTTGSLAEWNPTGVWDSDHVGVWHLGSNLEDVLQSDGPAVAHSIIHVGADIYAIAYQGPDDDGWLKTLKLASDGSVSGVLDSLEFDAVNGSGPSIIHMNNDIYVIAYKGTDNDGFVVTVDIDATGSIGSVQDSLEHHSAEAGNAFAMKVSSTICAIAFRDVASADGWIKTVDIAGDGTIGSVQDSLEFDASDCKNPTMYPVAGEIYAIAYRGVDNDGFLKTLDIDSNGNIGAIQDTLEFDTADNNFSRIAHVSGDIHAIAYQGVDQDGWLKTVDISAAGIIGSVQVSLEIDSAYFKESQIIQTGSGVYAVAYQGPDDDGFLKTVPIASDGTIGSVIQTVEFDTTSGRQVDFVQGPGERYALAYKGDANEGYFRPVQIASNGRIGGLADSTSKVNNGYTVGMDAGAVVTGKVGRGYVVDGSSDYGQVAHDATLSMTNTWTLSAWVNSNTLSGYDLVLNKGTSGTNHNYLLGSNADEMTHGFDNGSLREFNTSSENLQTGTWYHIAATFDDAADQVYLYLDGVEVLDSTTTESPVSNTEDLYIGRSQDGEYWDGKPDELRISSAVRSADWIQTSHTNQDAPASFYSVAAEEAPNDPPDAPSSLGGAGYVDGSAGIDKTPTLSFTQSDSDVGDSLSYRMQIDEAISFSSLVVDYTSASLAQGTTSFTVGQAPGSGTYTVGAEGQELSRGGYYWRVRSNDGSLDGAWTAANDGTLAFYVGLPVIGVCSSWYDTDWGYRKQITIDNTKVSTVSSGDLTNFPVLINRTDADWRDSGNGGKVEQADGGDIVFTASDKLTKLDHEIEFYDETTGELVAWVEVPTVSASTDTDIYIYYGNTNGIADQWDVAGTWDSNFAGVWHLSEEQAGTGGSGVYRDSTSNDNDGIDRVAATGQTGQVADGQEFGASDWIEIAHRPSVDLRDSMTISFWVRPTSDSGTFARVVEKGLWGYNNSYYFGGGNGTNDLTFYLNGQEVFDTANGVLTVGVWQHAAVSYTSNGDGTGTARLYLNGSEIATGNYTNGAVPGNTSRLAFGHSDPNYDFDGFMDEVRIPNTDRSADWIVTSYNNQDSPSTFYSVAAEENP